MGPGLVPRPNKPRKWPTLGPVNCILTSSTRWSREFPTTLLPRTLLQWFHPSIRTGVLYGGYEIVCQFMDPCYREQPLLLLSKSDPARSAPVISPAPAFAAHFSSGDDVHQLRSAAACRSTDIPMHRKCMSRRNSCLRVPGFLASWMSTRFETYSICVAAISPD